MLFPDRDPRLANWPLMENATQINLIVICYLLFIKVLGPAYMKGRQPYDLRKQMIYYNFGMVIYSAWMFYKFGKHGWFGKYNWFCEPVNFSADEDAMGMVQVCWHFFISKIVELLDTVFFILRKKDSQVTFLHVFHHALVPLTARYAISLGAAGFNTLFGFANTFIHIWMYLYYALAAVGPFMQKYLWWKKYLTTLQMIQFCVIITSMLSHVFLPGCDVNPVLIMISLGQGLVFLLLFAAFYRTAYRKNPTRVPDISVSKALTQQSYSNGTDLKHRLICNQQTDEDNV